MPLNLEQQRVKEYLDRNKVSWMKVAVADQKLLRETLRPSGAFTAEQTELLTDRWLEVTEAQLNAINAVLPTYTKVPGVLDLTGQRWIPGTVLTDCMQSGDTYYKASSLLSQLNLVYKSPASFMTPNVSLQVNL